MYFLRRWITLTSLLGILVIKAITGSIVHSEIQVGGPTTRVSVASDGTEGNDPSYNPSISATGRYVAFHSAASSLVSGDTNNTWDVFVHDRQAGTTTRASVGSDGTQSNGISQLPSISADGRYVAFMSEASNLISNDTNGTWDIFVKDRQTGITSRVSVASDGSQANGDSYSLSISADGRYVVFTSWASSLVAGDTNGVTDIFIKDRQTEMISRVSVASDGTQANDGSSSQSVSVDGRYVSFLSDASNLVAGDTNGVSDIFVKDRQTGTTSRVSVASDGTQANALSAWASVSVDGRYVVFRSEASNLVANDTNSESDIFVKDRQTETISRVSVASDGTQGNGRSYNATISGNGQYVAFQSTSSRLVVNDTNGVEDIFVHEREVTPISTPTITYTSTPYTTLTPTPIPTQSPANEAVFVPSVLRQLAFATPVPTPVPTCEVLDHEPNNFFSQANANLPLCEGGAVSGTVSVNDIDDFYRFQLDSAAMVQITLTEISIGADYDLYLYDATGGPVTVSNNSGSGNETIRVQLTSGRYYIRVYSLMYATPNTYLVRWVRE